jgi:hypothetical protein
VGFDSVSSTKFFIDGPMGNFQLTQVKSIKVDDQSDIEILLASGVKQGAGVRFKEGGNVLSLEVYRAKSPEVDYAKHKRLRSQFSITFQDEGGGREQYQQCFIAQVPRDDDEQGSHMMSIKVVSLQGPVPLPAG